jgi:hypothetical protein
VVSKYVDNLQEKKMLTSDQKNELVSYLKERYKSIRECAVSVEGFFDKEYKRYALQSKDNKLTPEIQKVLYDIDVNSITFRYCFLVGICSFVEDFLKRICEIVPDYIQKLNGYKGNWFKKHLEILKSERIDVALIEKQISLFEDIITVRNAIVHVWGQVDKVIDPDKLKVIIDKYKIDGTKGWIAVKKDGYLLIGDNALPTAITTTREIIEHILKSIPTK